MSVQIKMQYLWNILYIKCTKIYTHICQKQSTWIAHKLQRFLLGPNFSGTCKCEKRLEVIRGSQSSRPRYLEHNRGGRARREGSKKKLAEQTADKKAAL